MSKVVIDSDPVRLLQNIEKIHTTVLGLERIKNNLGLINVDIIKWAKIIISSNSSEITQKGKNWYIKNNKIILTVNKHSYTIITAHVIT